MSRLPETRPQVNPERGHRLLLTANRILMYGALVSTLAFGALAAVDTLIEFGLVASDVVPLGVNQLSSIVNGAVDLGLVGATAFSFNAFLHFRNEVHKITGKVEASHRAPQIPMPSRRKSG